MVAGCRAGRVRRPSSRGAQNSIIAYDVPPGTLGNEAVNGLVVGNHSGRASRSGIGRVHCGTNGIQGSTMLTVQLWERSGAGQAEVL